MMQIEKIMKQMNMNAEQFCKEFNIPKRTLAHWIKGDRTPPPYILELLQKVADKHNQTTSEK